MAGRGRTTYQKKLKEQVRLDRRNQKAARKEAREAARRSAPGGGPPIEPFEDDHQLDRTLTPPAGNE